MTQAYFLTGTDTDAGKTLIAAALLEKFRQQGLQTLGLKPLAAGGTATAEGLCNKDALLLQAVSTLKLPYSEVNPVLLAEPMAPHIAAAREGKHLSVDKLVGYTRGAIIASPNGVKADVCIVEGAGGWRVPLTPHQTTADFAKALNLPVILVVGMKLGCLNHALLTLEAIQRDGLTLAGWVATQVDPDMSVVEENLNTLKAMLPERFMGFVPWQDKVDVEKVAGYLDVLLEKPQS